MNKQNKAKKRMVTKVVPWVNKAELKAVYDGLYSGDPVEQRWAVNRISAWKARCFQTFPVSIEVTDSLVGAMIQDKLMTDNNLNFLTFKDITCLYSTAIVRFVNLVSELKQGKRDKVSMASLAKMCGVPESLVSIRNDIAHSGRTPNLEKVREAAQMAFSWLEENFWKKELENYTDFIPNYLEVSEDAIRHALFEYQEARCKELYSIKYHRHAARRLGQLCQIIEKEKDLFIRIIVQPEYLLSITAHAQQILDDDSFLEEETVILPSSMEAFWEPLIEVLCMNELIEDLIVALLVCHSNVDPVNQRMAIAWILKFLKASVELWVTDEELSPIYQILRKYPQCFYWLRMATTCLKNPTKYVPSILPILVEHVDPPLSDERKNRLMALVAIYIGALVDVPPNHDRKPENLFNIVDVKTTLEIKAVSRKGKTTIGYDENPWQLCNEEIDWESIPIGSVLGLDEEIKVKDLELFKESVKNEEEPNSKESEVMMECVPYNENECKIEYFNIESFEENATIEEECTLGNDQSNINWKLEDIIMF